MNNLSFFVLQAALQQQKSPNLEIHEIIDRIMSEFQSKQTTKYLTPKQVASLFNVDLGTVRNWTKKGKIKAYRYGHRVFYKLHELIQSLNPINF